MHRQAYVLAAAGIFACAGQNYVYTPQNPNVVSSGMAAARTPIPQERPLGAVEVSSYGVTHLNTGEANIPALHVRMIVTNDGDDTPWRLDSSQQLVEIPGEGRSAPMYVNADVRTLPNVTIARRDRRVLDLYYAMPTTIERDADLPRFDMLWQVETGLRSVASRTAFDRVEPVGTYAQAYGTTWPLWAGYGPLWWYDPLYPRHVVFVNRRPIVIHDHRGPVVIGRFNGRFRPHGTQIVRRGKRR